MKNEIQLLETISIIDETLPSRELLIENLRLIFSDITRYPLDIIDARADLEMDLGIDSVKLGEIVAALRERYRLPAPEVMKALPPERFRTIEGIAGIVAEFRDTADAPAAALVSPAAPDVSAAPAAMPAAPIAAPMTAVAPAAVAVPAIPAAPVQQAPMPVAPAAAVPAATATVSATVSAAITDAELLAEVTRTFADITRYPLDILEADADFENDLGIDSVKLGEIFAVLRQKFDLPSPEVLRETWSADATRTIRGIVDGIVSLRPAVNEAPPAVKAIVPAVQPAAAIAQTAAAIQAAAPAPRKFEGKIVLITGSGRGLGRDLALHMGALGATVLVNSFHSREAGENTTEEIRRAGGTAHHLWASVANPAQLNAMFDSIETQFGGLDFFVSNASNGMLAPLDQITPEHWEKAFRTNVIGLQQCALRASALMKKRGGGRIVTLSSVAAHRYTDYFGCMGPIKAAVESLSKFLAVELQPHNIRVNCISAGAVYGALVDKWPERDRLVPMWEAGAGGRLCNSADIANLMEYLLADGAAMMNGAVLVLDGGQAVR
ncbi:SDR family oxidoreductase [Oxalobacteraceae bacterium CAVE-383]|nr:SDR family oxidoreductase [Oxalobacteraceae bacterium CAVE-383]